VLKKINSGGFGITYLAEELTGAKIVLKEYFPPLFASRDAHTSTVVPLPGCENDYFRYLELFEREAKQLASMHHPSIVSLSAAFQENNTAYYAMPYIGGGSLSQAVKAMRAGKVYLSQIAVLHILRSLLNALDHMHSRKLHGKPIYHLDIKPGNVLLTDEEYRKLKERFPDCDERIENMSVAIAIHGYKYDSHYLAIIKWASNDKKKSKQEKSSNPFLDMLQNGEC
jgi:serine/threonine protein kinase